MGKTYARLIRLATARWALASLKTDVATIAKVRNLIEVHGRLPVTVDQLGDRDNLFAAGLRSFAAVQLFMAIEDTFDVTVEKFDNLLSIETISASVSRPTDVACLRSQT